ncbi:thioredoxin family protein [Fulvivirga sedimenti]|uniref:Thioredoxin family protein n=1 Tax=Fulvivirga sedimenti TaxID=2879465 RepID=A0A9X1HSR6_9BACT|nr:thioredoxin family protein [Fulvivirga sedimenti]MCA6075378.1 thioredoxin family protein [Fulvivirga sedimenti]MCA6076555.1 thioredoxin family protein [Fulvivirga sedimenti]MCA6077683.1 thioredoxin family protein [Fulvivirga sedimenti]
MALTPSKMLPLGTEVPDFTLPDTVSGQNLSYADVRGEKGTLVMFICNHCPYVKHVQSELVKISVDYSGEGIGFVAISSNDVEKYPEDGPDRMREVARKWGYSFPYLFDETQGVAKDFQAACTPDFYLFDHQDKLVYRGQLDSSRPGNGKPLDGKDMRQALNDLVNGNPVSENQIPSQGCNIKWKS